MLSAKNMVPLMLQNGYKADGWLGALLGTTLWFDCTTKSKMQESFPNFLREIQRVADLPNLVVPSDPATPSATHGHGAIVPSSSSSSSSSSPPTITPPPALKWSVEEVCTWLSENGLSAHVKPIRKQGIDGKAIVTLASLMTSARDLDVLKELGIGRFVDQLKFTAGIKMLL